MRIRLRSIAIVMVVGSVICVSGWAQEQPPQTARAAADQASAAARIQQAAAQPTPKSPDGHPDLTGYWAIQGAGGDAASSPRPSLDRTGNRAVANITEDDEIRGDAERPKARWANKSLRPAYKPEFAKQQEEQFFRADFLDPSYRCEPEGVPRIGPPTEILATPQSVVFLYQHRNIYRTIPTNGRGHDKDADAMAMGDSVARWEGDTLLVDVNNFSPDTWIDRDGSWHDENLHVIERFTRKGNTLTYEVTVEDPTLFVEPFKPKPVTLILGAPERHAGEDYPCVEKSRAHMVTEERH
jgi:hypothetical protein